VQFIEALIMALAAIRTHKLRSSLTLVGIIAGVASIIAVMTSIAVVQNTMEEEMRKQVPIARIIYIEPDIYIEK